VEQPDGGYRWVRSDVAVVQRYPDGSADVVGTATNVTKEHELATRMALVGRMTTLGEISTSIAHELSQPVTVISLAAEQAQILAEHFDQAGDLRAQIEAILAQSKRAGEIIRHLRGYGHAEGGALGPVDLKQAITSALELAGRPLAEAAVEVELDLPADLPPVHGRQVQVEQLLLNLAINARDALRATQKDGRKLRISAEVQAAGAAAADDQIVVSVADNGPGIAPGVIARVFDPFFTTKKMGEGTGLGLSLCRMMMEGFGGSISVENALPGAVFRLRFMPEAGAQIAA
jgi:C4-dicarboxylate-specific signal transduction histidine kinase